MSLTEFIVSLVLTVAGAVLGQLLARADQSGRPSVVLTAHRVSVTNQTYVTNDRRHAGVPTGRTDDDPMVAAIAAVAAGVGSALLFLEIPVHVFYGFAFSASTIVSVSAGLAARTRIIGLVRLVGVVGTSLVASFAILWAAFAATPYGSLDELRDSRRRLGWAEFVAQNSQAIPFLSLRLFGVLFAVGALILLIGFLVEERRGSDNSNWMIGGAILATVFAVVLALGWAAALLESPPVHAPSPATSTTEP